MDALRYTSLKTPIGTVYVAYQGAAPRLITAAGRRRFLAMVSVLFGPAVHLSRLRHPRLEKAILATIVEGCAYKGEIRLSGLTPFQERVLDKAREIPCGQVWSYARLAAAIHSPKAVRAVGTALARNPLPFIIPCHRVVRSDGTIGGYSGGGRRTKERLLRLERALLRGKVRAP